MTPQSSRAPLFLILSSLSKFTEAESGFLESAPKGWNWYQAPPPPSLSAQKSQKKVPHNSSQIITLPTASLKKRFEDKLEEAVTSPTLENVRAVQALQRQILMQATQFEQMWMLASLLDGKGFQKEDHTNNLHRQLLEEEQEKALALLLRQLSHKFGLFLLFKKECPYCEKFAPIAQAFAETYGFSLLGVTASGGTLAGLKTVSDNGLVDRVNPQRVFPVLILVAYEDPSKIIPLAWGLVNLSDLRENAKRVAQFLEAQALETGILGRMHE